MTEDEPQSRIVRVIERVKAHPVRVVIVAVVGTIGFVWLAVDLGARTYDAIDGWLHPHSEQYAELAQLDLDSRLSYLEGEMGTAKQVVDLCADQVVDCPRGAPPLLMYVHESDDLVVRSVFEKDSLELYAVTRVSDRLAPPMRWLDWDLGDLGDVTFAEATEAPGVEPTSAWVWMGPRGSAYAEVVTAGAAGRYRGLLLGWARDGYGGPDAAFDVESANELQTQSLAGEPYDTRTLAAFRAGTTPNTWGEFRDDGGTVGGLAHDAEQVMLLLSVGAGA
ncbi:hypothetical protein CLV56_1170 [Mumia flava]|uniref:Uncharacterized protein n=1 Tax=Mumia flava TaxID=1348852 RepID=A0A2M9BG91_9ACTN|nr:ETEC_3214 domain-containing protein [Mumia flava]PJJ56952.1 hypothetical protein CLV56_1170 [Mumia flava]